MADVFPYVENAGWKVEYGLAVGNQYNDPECFLKHHAYMRKTHVLDGRVGTATARQHAIRRLLSRVQADVVMPLAIGDAMPAFRKEKSRGLESRLFSVVHSTHVGTLADIFENQDIVDMVGVVSGLLNQWARHCFADDIGRVRWIPNGVPLPTTGQVIRHESALCVGYIGRLENEIKRVHDVPAIIHEAINTGTPIRLEVVGDGPSQSFILSRLQSISGWYDFHLYGHKDRSFIYEKILPKLDCLILTSVTEGSPLAVIEAMQHGVVPVVSQFHGHAAEGMLRPEENCLTFPVGDIGAAAKQLHRLASDRALLERLSKSAQESAKPYTRQNMLEGWLTALDDLIALPPKPIPNNVTQEKPNYGRLERWGIPSPAANWLRGLKKSQYVHASGFDEWPGSLSGNTLLLNQVKHELMNIESECFARMYMVRD